MALNLINLEETAQMLGISPDAVNELRERRQLHGYRDGASWKFKRQDVERLARERQAEGSGEGDQDSDDDFSDVVLLSEQELGESPSASSTVIGKPGQYDPAESDIRLITPEDRRRAVEAAGAAPPAKAAAPQAAGSRPAPADEGTDDLVLPADDPSAEISLELMDSGVNLASVEPAQPPGSDVSLVPDAAPAEDDPLSLELEDDSSFEISGGDEAAGVLELDEDVDVLAPRPSGSSDVTLAPADSGISLASPSDSGLSLEAPLKLGPGATGAGEDAFELGDEAVLSLEGEADSAELAELSSEDDFLLSPLEEAAEADAASSGSQVIGLPEDELAAGPGSLLDEGSMSDMLAEGFGDSGEIEAAPLSGAAFEAPQAPVGFIGREPPYTSLNIASLAACLLFLLLSGTMAFDLLRNMWSWQGEHAVNSPLMELIGGLF